jgi:hypothetical protein
VTNKRAGKGQLRHATPAQLAGLHCRFFCLFPFPSTLASDQRARCTLTLKVVGVGSANWACDYSDRDAWVEPARGSVCAGRAPWAGQTHAYCCPRPRARGATRVSPLAAEWSRWHVFERDALQSLSRHSALAEHHHTIWPGAERRQEVVLGHWTP